MNRLLFIPLTLFILACFAVRYLGDDWWDIDSVRERGVLGSVRHLYFNWTGRYIYGLAVYGAKLLPVWLPSLLTIAILGTGLFRLTKHTESAALLTLAVLVTVPTAQVFYWQSALMNYGLPIALLAWLAYAWKKGWEVAGALLVVVIIGLSDTAAMVMPILVVGWWYLTPERRHWPTALVTLACLVIWYAAPGNIYRFEGSARAPLLISIVYGLKGSGLPLASAIRAGPALLLAVAVLPGRWQPMERNPRLALVAGLGIASISVGSMVACYIAVGGPLAARAQSIPIAIALLCAYTLSRIYSRPSPRLAIVALMLAALLGTAKAVYTLGVLTSPSQPAYILDALW